MLCPTQISQCPDMLSATLTGLSLAFRKICRCVFALSCECVGGGGGGISVRLVSTFSASDGVGCLVPHAAVAHRCFNGTIQLVFDSYAAGIGASDLLMTVDTDDNDALYVTGNGMNRVVRVLAWNMYSVIAGGSWGILDGVGTSAGFRNPRIISAAGPRQLAILDQSFGYTPYIRMVDVSTGLITTVGGNRCYEGSRYEWPTVCDPSWSPEKCLRFRRNCMFPVRWPTTRQPRRRRDERPSSKGLLPLCTSTSAALTQAP